MRQILFGQAPDIRVLFIWFYNNNIIIIATSPAKKHLSDGRNAHLIVENPGWWKPLIEKHIDGKIIHHEFAEKTRTDKKGVVHPNNKYVVVVEKNA